MMSLPYRVDRMEIEEAVDAHSMKIVAYLINTMMVSGYAVNFRYATMMM